MFRLYFGLLIFGTVVAFSVIADTYVQGYFRSDGTYVQPHYRSSPDSTKLNNLSQKGSVSPYTGKRGTKDCGYNCSNYNYKQKKLWK